MSDTITKIASEYDMVEIMQNIGNNYFGSDLSQQRVGMFGYLTESMAHMFGATVLDSSSRANEYNTATAKRLETLLCEAAIYGIDVTNAVPETMSAYIGIATSNITNPPHQGGFSTQEKDIDNLDHPKCTLVLEKDTVISIADYDFMFEYDIQIKATWSNTANKYVYAVKYLTEGDVDETSTTPYTYPEANTLIKLPNTYIQSYVTTSNGESILLFKVNLKQMTKYTDYYSVTKNDMISLTGIDFLYNTMLSHFNVYYKENNKQNWEYIKAVSIYDNKTYDEKIVHYEVLHDESKIRINFDDFTPAYNSEFRVDMYGTLGSSVNGITYTGDGSDIIVSLNSLDERHNYAGLNLSCRPLTSYSDGSDIPTLEEIRDRVIRTKASLNSLDTEYDLYNYIKGKDKLNDYVFIKKRSDARERRYSAFTIPRMETEDIIPSSTLNLCIPTKKIYRDLEVSGNIVNSGLEYPKVNNEGVTYSDIITLKAGTPLIINSSPNHDDSGIPYQLCKAAINNAYKDADDEFYKNNTLMVLDRTESEEDANGNLAPRFPDTKSIIDTESVDEKVFSVPYTIAYDTKHQLTSFYLNSISRDVNMTMVEDELNTIVNFAIDHISISRNAVMGDNSYKITVDVMPNGDATKAISEDIVNSGNLANVIMLKGFMYKTLNENAVDGYFDFKFESYSDDVFTFSSEIKIDDSLDNDSSCSIMQNLHIIENLNVIDEGKSYTYENASGKILNSKYYKSECNAGYLNMNVFNLKLSIGVYFLDYDLTNNGLSFTKTCTTDTDAGDRVLASLSDTLYIADTHAINTSTSYPNFIMECVYGNNSIVPMKYTLANVYDNSSDIIDLYVDMSDYVKSTSQIITLDSNPEYIVYEEVDRPDKLPKSLSSEDIKEYEASLSDSELRDWKEWQQAIYYYSKSTFSYKKISDEYIVDDYVDPNHNPTIIESGDTLSEADADDLENNSNIRMNLLYPDTIEGNDNPDGSVQLSDETENKLLDYRLRSGDSSGLEELEQSKLDEFDPDKSPRYKKIVSNFKDSQINFIILSDVPVMQFSKAMDIDESTQLIKTISNSHEYLNEMNERITNNFSIDYKFFRTYGPGRYFELSTVDGEDKYVTVEGCNCGCETDKNTPTQVYYKGVKPLNTLDISIEFTILIRNGLSISDADVVSRLKNHIKSYIENLNEQESDYTIYMSNIITELETNYIDFIKSIELVSINGEPDIYRILRYKLPDELRSDNYNALSSNSIREYIPEYINVPLDNIAINVTRPKY